MYTTRIKRLLLAAVIASPAVVVRADEASAPSVMDGVWQVTVSPDEAAKDLGKQEFSDLVMFEEGVMTASACASYGFAPASFTTSEDGIRFTSTMSADNEIIVWSGAVSGWQIQGQVSWTKADGHTYVYTLVGERHKEAPGDD